MSARWKLALSYAGFLMVAGTLLLAVVVLSQRIVDTRSHDIVDTMSHNIVDTLNWWVLPLSEE